jgi:hypothetical protein
MPWRTPHEAFAGRSHQGSPALESVTGHGQVVLQTILLDGRNRRVACKQAKVRPDVHHLNGEDPTAYVLSANVHRRHMTKGQRAMVVAVIYPEPECGRGKKDPARAFVKGAETASFRRIQEARWVLRYSIEGDLARDVMAATMTLDTAYDIARQRRDAASSEDSRLAELRTAHPPTRSSRRADTSRCSGGGSESGCARQDTACQPVRPGRQDRLLRQTRSAGTRTFATSVKALRAHAADFQTHERWLAR